jgi:hypothetical protein
VSNRDVNQPFADWLRTRMRAWGYPPEGGSRIGGRSRLAKDAGLDLSVISRALNEGRVPSIESMRLLAKPLRSSLDEMLIVAGHAVADDFSFTPKAEPQASVLDAIKSDPLLDDTDKRALLGHYRGLLVFARQRREYDHGPPVQSDPTSPSPDHALATTPDPSDGRDPSALSPFNVSPAPASS